ncbi:hypothetical protein ACOSQ4_014242 [Xanthoceras sorbifolium]
MVLDPWLKVADLKSPSGGWDSNLIWSSFLPDEAHIILNLSCSSTAHHDSLLWLLGSLEDHLACQFT